MLLSMAVPGCGAAVACFPRMEEVAGSSPAALTKTFMVRSEAKAVVITTGTNGTDRRANKRGEATTDN